MTTGFSQTRTNPSSQNEELGKVSWYRDYDEAIAAAKKQGKSVLILFQEIPGCATCRNYGHDVLSNPLLTEAIEDQFIPLAIHNNKGGKDKVILNKFREPSWNNPVVRIINTDGQDLTKRVAGDYSSLGLYKAMETALFKTNKFVPEYMKVLGEELYTSNSGKLKEQYFKMYCFWTGEKHLASSKGVVSAEAGFMGGHEVVKVKYDERLIEKKDLFGHAKHANMIPVNADGSYRFSSKDHFYYLRHTNYRFVPLSNLQKTKINSALGDGKSAEKYLSPKQLVLLNALDNPKTKRKVLVDQDIAQVWTN